MKEIKISSKDFKIIFEGFAEICNEYSGAQHIEEVYKPILRKYYSLYQEIEGDN